MPSKKMKPLRLQRDQGKKLNLEYVQWVDSSSMHYQIWRSLDQIEMSETLIHTVGTVIAEDKKNIQLAMNFDETGNVSGDITIPKVSILKRKQLFT